MITQQNLYISIDLWGAFFCLIAIVSILIGKSYDKKGARLLIAIMICSMLLLISDVCTRFFAGAAAEAAHPYMRYSTYFTFFFGFLIIPLVAEYLTHVIVSRSNIEGLMWKYAEWFIFVLGIVLLTVNLFNGFIYTHDSSWRLTWSAARYVPSVVGIFSLIISIGVVLEYQQYFNKFEKVAFITYLLLPLIAISYGMFSGDLSFVILALVISTLVLYFSYLFNSREYRVELERNLAEQQITMFHHQIQPHFIFNSLAVIKYQCRRSPEDAIGTIDEFADYLRGCTDMMSETETVPVERELDLVSHYINLQMERFGDQIDYRTDIEDTDFEIPSFTIQTCVENSFTHGLKSQQMEGGYISVKTYRSRSSHVIEIEDNGAGFDTKELESGRPQHIGLKNTEERIRLMCNGSFLIESEPGKGTKVTITVPGKKKAEI